VAKARLALAVFTGLLALGQPAILPLSQVKTGMKGTGRTVFQGTRVEEFQVEVLGILENIGPKQSVILARISGGPIDRTGVMQGMSGSPVYIGGRLVGALALSFPFSKEPIAGIRPIEEMLRVAEAPATARAAAAFPKPQEISSGGTRLVDIATPVWFAGFTRAAVDHFAQQWREAGLEPVQGISGGGRVVTPSGPVRLEPGSMISVQLMTGDLSVGADGTVTSVVGNKVFAFGHRFLSIGNTELPFARAEVLTLMPNLQSSFKISTAREWLGSITQDRSVALAGELGRRARMIPTRIQIRRGTSPAAAYKIELADDRLMTPLLLQMAVFSALDATERTVGAQTITLSGRLDVDGAARPIPIANVYSGDLGAPQMVAAGAVSPLAYLLQAGFPSLRLRAVDLTLDVLDGKRQLNIDNVLASRREVRPGDTLDLYVSLLNSDGNEVARSLRYKVPTGEPAGTLNFTVCDAVTANVAEYRQFLQTPPRTPAQMLSFLGSLRTGDKAYVRVWRPHPSFQVQGETLPDPPPSLALLLGKTQTPVYGSRVAEFEVSGGLAMVSGSRTVSVEVKE